MKRCLVVSSVQPQALGDLALALEWFLMPLFCRSTEQQSLPVDENAKVDDAEATAPAAVYPSNLRSRGLLKNSAASSPSTSSDEEELVNHILAPRKA